MRAHHSSSYLEHSSQLFLCCVSPLACVRSSASIAFRLCLSRSYPNSNHVKQKSTNDPSRLPRVYTVAGSCCRQRYLVYAVHASSHTAGSWCPTLLWVSDGTGQITLLRLDSNLGPIQFYTAQLPFGNDANFVNHPGPADVKIQPKSPKFLLDMRYCCSFSLVSLGIRPRSRRCAERTRQGDGRWSRPPRATLERSYST